MMMVLIPLLVVEIIISGPKTLVKWILLVLICVQKVLLIVFFGVHNSLC